MNAISDPRELAKFEAMADGWWDPDGPFRPLHDLNPVRLAFVKAFADLEGLAVLDVGCGAGLFSEALARSGATVTGIDLAVEPLARAEEHAREAELDISYQLTSVDAHAGKHIGRYDLVTCLEMLEHVPQPEQVINACAKALRPGGRIILSTLNRTPKAFVQGILGAEYVLGLLPRGTHEYRRFIRPSELARACRASGLSLLEQRGLVYNPFARLAAMRESVGVNYIACYEKPNDEDR